MTPSTLNQLRDNLIGVADATFAFQGQLQRRLREIDRKALNAQVLVRRHGKDLAGYGVVAQSFREGAQQLQHAAAMVQRAIQPLMLSFMETLRDTQQIEKIASLPAEVRDKAPQLQESVRRHHRMLDARRDHSRHASMRLRQSLYRVEHIVAELDYVVINGRIEAALKADVRGALAQVSADMNKAVVQVRSLLRQYAEHISKVLP